MSSTKFRSAVVKEVVMVKEVALAVIELMAMVAIIYM